MSGLAIQAVIESMYAALGNRPEFDKHLHPDITIWESDAERMLTGIAELDALRDRRGVSDGPAPTVTPEEFHVDVWEGTAVARYLLRARYGSADPPVPDECFRVTDVLRLDDDAGHGWRIMHHHAEALRR